MCWVMPPASPAATSEDRMASSSDVLPWSTWPITVTTGARGASSAGSSATSNRPSSTSASATRRTVWPISSAISCAVSASITSLIVTIWPCFISRRMTSTARSDMRLARSWMVIASGIVTSRTSFSFGSLDAMPLSRCVRRRNEATERSRTSSARSAVTSVRRPRCFSTPARGAGRGAAGARAAPGRRGRGRFLVIGFEREAGSRSGPGGSSTPKRFLATSPALRLVSSSCLWRSSSSRLRASAASRSLRSTDSRPARRRASSSAILRSSASRTRESASAWARALRSSSVRVRSTTPDAFGFASVCDAPARAVGAGAGVLLGAGFFVSTTGAGSALASPGPPTARRLPSRPRPACCGHG